MKIFARSIDTDSRSPGHERPADLSLPHGLARDWPIVSPQDGLARSSQQQTEPPGKHLRAALVSYQQAQAPKFREQWTDLAEHAADPNPFYAPWFLLPSIAWLADADKINDTAEVAQAGTPASAAAPQAARLSNALKLFCVLRGDQLLGLMPITRNTNYYDNPLPHLCNWRHPNMFCGTPLVRQGAAHDFWQELLALADKQAGYSAFLHIAEIPERSHSCAALRDVLQAQGREAAIVERAERAALISELGSEAYFTQAMTQKKRKELRRQRKRLSELGDLSFTRSEGSDSIEDWADAFLALEASGWKGEAGSALASDQNSAAFFRTALVGGARAGHIERLTLALDGRPIAMLANLLCEPGVYSFKTAYDENYARFSPGVLLQQENLELLDRCNIRWADSCAREGHPMIERIWRERRPVISANIAIGGALRRRAFRWLSRYETGAKPKGL